MDAFLSTVVLLRLQNILSEFIVSSSTGTGAAVPGYLREVSPSFRILKVRFSLNYLSTVSWKKIVSICGGGSAACAALSFPMLYKTVAYMLLKKWRCRWSLMLILFFLTSLWCPTRKAMVRGKRQFWTMVNALRFMQAIRNCRTRIHLLLGRCVLVEYTPAHTQKGFPDNRQRM